MLNRLFGVTLWCKTLVLRKDSDPLSTNSLHICSWKYKGLKDIMKVILLVVVIGILRTQVGSERRSSANTGGRRCQQKVFLIMVHCKVHWFASVAELSPVFIQTQFTRPGPSDRHIHQSIAFCLSVVLKPITSVADRAFWIFGINFATWGHATWLSRINNKFKFTRSQLTTSL